MGYLELDGLGGTMVHGEGWEVMMVRVSWSANDGSSRRCVVMGTGHDRGDEEEEGIKKAVAGG